MVNEPALPLFVVLLLALGYEILKRVTMQLVDNLSVVHDITTGME